MEISEVRVKLVENKDDRLKAFCSVTMDNEFVVRDIKVIEGAGGFYSPLAEDALNADLASALQLPVIIVVNDRIGAVNQALMTIAAVESRHLPVAAVIMNQLETGREIGMNNLQDLARYCSYPVFKCLYKQSLEGIFKSDINL